MSCADKEQYKKLVDLLGVAKSRMEDVVNGLEPRSYLEDPVENITSFLEEDTNSLPELVPPDNKVEPEIQRHFVASMSHITHSDYQLLQKANFKSANISADEFPYGWRIYVQPREYDEDIKDSQWDLEKACLMEEGYSENFCTLYFRARELECTFLCLDCDGTEYPDLEMYEW